MTKNQWLKSMLSVWLEFINGSHRTLCGWFIDTLSFKVYKLQINREHLKLGCEAVLAMMHLL